MDERTRFESELSVLSQHEYAFETLHGSAQCASYGPGEIATSRTAQGFLSVDFITDPNGYPLIADFAVASHSIKNVVKADAAIKVWLLYLLSSVSTANSVSLKITGYSDCVGEEKNNEPLRLERARQVFNFLNQLAGNDQRWKVLERNTKVVNAPTGRYVIGNQTAVERATNRSVVLELTKVLKFKPIHLGPCINDILKRSLALLGTPRTAQLMGNPRVERLRYMVKKLNTNRVDDRYLTETDVYSIVRTGLGMSSLGTTWRRAGEVLDKLCRKGSMSSGKISDDEILHGLWRFDNTIVHGICKLIQQSKSLRPATGVSIPFLNIQVLFKIVSDRMSDLNSIYFGYRNTAQLECRSTQKPIPPIKDWLPSDQMPVPVPKPITITPTMPPTLPRPYNVTVHSFTDPSIPEWIKTGISGVAKIANVGISAGMSILPALVLEKAIRHAFELRRLARNTWVGLAGELAAEMVAEWFLSKSGGGKVFNLNSIRKNYIGLDLITSREPISVKVYGIRSKFTGAELEKQLASRYKKDVLKLIGSHDLDKRFQKKIAVRLIKDRDIIQKAGVSPTALSGVVTPDKPDNVIKFIRENSVLGVPDDHVQLIHRNVGNHLLEMYKKGGLPGIQVGLSDNAAAPLISKMLSERVRSIGIKSTDIQLLLDVAERLPSARDTVIRGGKRNWPSSWGTPPTWTSVTK